VTLRNSAQFHRFDGRGSSPDGIRVKGPGRPPRFQVKLAVHATLQAGDVRLLAARKRTAERPVMTAENAPQRIVKYPDNIPGSELPGNRIS
jgi:hypothetical protein